VPRGGGAPGRWSHAILAIGGALAVAGLVVGASLLGARRAPAPVVPGPATSVAVTARVTATPDEAIEQRRLVGLVPEALGAALAGRPLPDELSPEVQGQLRELLVARVGPDVQRQVVAWHPAPFAWERADPMHTGEDPRVQATWEARVWGDVTVRYAYLPTPQTTRYAGGGGHLLVQLAKHDGRWVITAVGGSIM